MENQQRLKYLLGEYIGNRLEFGDFSELFDLLGQADRDHVQVLLDELLNTEESLSHPNMQQRIHAVHHNLIAEIEQTQLSERYERRQNGNRRLWKWSMIGAAAAVLLAFLGLRYLVPQQASDERNTPRTAAIADVMPGSNKAILEIGGEEHALDGRKAGIILGASEVQYQDGADAKIAIHDPSATVRLRTPRGGQYAVVMPDGTRIWLNAATQLSYTARYGKRDRTVELNGEAYFEVEKNAALPFIVKSKGQEIKVLGTSFNVNAYQDETSLRTTLVEGALLLSTAKGSLSILPDEQASWNMEDQLMYKAKVDVSRAVAWKEGVIDLHEMGLEECMKIIGRWYDLDVVYQGRVPDVVLGGKMSRGVKLSVFLKFLKQSFDVTTQLQDGKLVIQGI
ncbi:FecR family protein [Sphingobacterium corticibacterium]|uniref:FecR family protein n=1 Tax=Sphingobacterium corticibacterium TaxID=2484746 RepID=A0A4Q6XS81_9SPHI|nr:FecR family protein [Sphingobacterium corticibacterium]RZF60372.1 FecR family protein [Sphingobacterium corticibacterium]